MNTAKLPFILSPARNAVALGTSGAAGTTRRLWPDARCIPWPALHRLASATQRALAASASAFSPAFAKVFASQAPASSPVPITWAAHHIRRYIVGATTHHPCCTPEHFAVAEALIARFALMYQGNPHCEAHLLCLRQDLMLVRSDAALRDQSAAIRALQQAMPA